MLSAGDVVWVSYERERVSNNMYQLCDNFRSFFDHHSTYHNLRLFDLCREFGFMDTFKLLSVVCWGCCMGVL